MRYYPAVKDRGLARPVALNISNNVESFGGGSRGCKSWGMYFAVMLKGEGGFEEGNCGII